MILDVQDGRRILRVGAEQGESGVGVVSSDGRDCTLMESLCPGEETREHQVLHSVVQARPEDPAASQDQSIPGRPRPRLSCKPVGDAQLLNPSGHRHLCGQSACRRRSGSAAPLEWLPSLLAFIPLVQLFGIHEPIKRTYGVSQYLGVISFQSCVGASPIFSLYAELKDSMSPWPQESLQAVIESVRDQSGKNRRQGECEDDYSQRLESELVAPSNVHRADSSKVLGRREQVLVRPVRCVCLKRNWSHRLFGGCRQISNGF